MQKLKCKNKRKEEKLLGDSKTVLKSSGQKLTVTPCLERGSHLNREIYKENLFILESHEEAKIRTAKRKALEEAGLRKVKRHSPDSSSLDFDKAGLLQEVNAMKEGEKVSIN